MVFVAFATSRLGSRLSARNYLRGIIVCAAGVKQRRNPMRTAILSSFALAAALIGGPQVASAQAPTERAFCLRDQGGALLCNYDTMVLCEEGRLGRTGTCIANPGLTTGGPVVVPPRGSSDLPSASPAPPPGMPSTEQMPRR